MGANAFAHESGIHQDGMLKNKSTYEIITPEEIGLVRADEAGIVMGEPHATHPFHCLCGPFLSLGLRTLGEEAAPCFPEHVCSCILVAE